ncbi:MAG: hypothetical protein IT497_06665 [Ottowia sp.]|nr:hypothetical protein [Ottowia sp.]
MSSLLATLYDALDLELDEDAPMLMIDDHLAIHFATTETGLEMICPIGPLPNDVAQLQQLLVFNYQENAVILAADADAECLLALLKLEGDHNGSELIKHLEKLIETASTLKEKLTQADLHTPLLNEKK